MPKPPRDGQKSTRRLVVWFGLAAIVPAGALLWLGWAIVRMDRDRDAGSRRTAREQAAELAATALQRTLAELEEQVSTVGLGQPARSGPTSEDVAVITFNRDELLARAGLSLPFYPGIARPSPRHVESLDRAEALEFRQRDNASALRLLDPLAASDDPTIRAEALVRLGRLQRKQGNITGAVEAFERLANLDTTVVNGQPAGLVGAQGRALVFAAVGRRTELEHTAADLLRDLERGRWLLSRAEYEFALQQAREWLGQVQPLADDERRALATAGESVWSEWRATTSGGSATRGRTTVFARDRSVLVLTRGSGEQLTTMLVGPGFLDRHWRTVALVAADIKGIDLALTDPDGRAVVGDPRVALDRQSVRPASVTRLPWTVHAIAPETSPSSLSRQAVLMLTGIGVMMLVVGAGGYLITRALARELRVARLQSDFVSAVSHEFRTPLTTVRQLSELLAGGRVSTDQRRKEFYDVLVRESVRLHRLVESLLNFARLEAGELEYQFVALSPGSFVRDVVKDFQGENLGRKVHIELAGDESPLPTIQADRELLSRVIWNLLDNAVKYSPDPCQVHVEIETTRKQLMVRVRDRGVGIPADERLEIFDKFVRGAAAKAASIKGTGIGLAMTRQIVRAHGGEIVVESEVGAGSTFTVTLPLTPAPERDAAITEPTNSHSGLATALDDRR